MYKYHISLENREVKTDDVLEFDEAIKGEGVPMLKARCSCCSALMVDVAQSCQTPDARLGEVACVNQACDAFHQVVIAA